MKIKEEILIYCIFLCLSIHSISFAQINDNLDKIVDYPLFLDVFNNDYHLRWDSPCIDAGDPSSPTDTDGTRTDMGIYYCEQVGQELSINKDWNWISFNVHPLDTSIGSVFEPLTKDDDVYEVKSINLISIWDPSSWIGDLEFIKDGEGYKIDMINAFDPFEVIGCQIDPQLPIYLSEGWNWVAYYPTYNLPLAVAMACLEDNVDQVKNQTQSSTYYDPIWIGNLTEMAEGIMYEINMHDVATLIYPEESKYNPRKVVYKNAKNWQVMVGTEYNMVLMAEIDLDSLNIKSKDVSVGAFDDEGICRAVGIPQYVDNTELWYFTIVGNEGYFETVDIHFELCDEGKGRCYRSNEKVLFRKDIIIGSPKELFNINLLLNDP